MTDLLLVECVHPVTRPSSTARPPNSLQYAHMLPLSLSRRTGTARRITARLASAHLTSAHRFVIHRFSADLFAAHPSLYNTTLPDLLVFSPDHYLCPTATIYTRHHALSPVNDDFFSNRKSPTPIRTQRLPQVRRGPVPPSPATSTACPAS